MIYKTVLILMQPSRLSLKFVSWKKVRPEKSSTFSLLELFSGRTFFLDSGVNVGREVHMDNGAGEAYNHDKDSYTGEVR